jgi:hypothetical protein
MIGEAFEDAVFFTLPELAELSGLTSKRLRHILETSGVTLTRSGRYVLVCRIELREAMPQVYEALLQRAQRQAA